MRTDKKMPHIIRLDGQTPLELLDVGGKAASLNRLLSVGFNVPRAFAIKTSAFSTFLKEAEIEDQVTEALEALKFQSAFSTSKAIAGLFLEQQNLAFLETELEPCLRSIGSEFVAVRSSAIFEDGERQSWAGLFDSYLSVPNNTSNVMAAIVGCWASLFSSRAINYSKETFAKSTIPEMAVIVQEMIDGDASGVAFTQVPDGPAGNVLIEAARGKGDELVSGKVIPFSAEIARNSYEIVKEGGPPGNLPSVGKDILKCVAAKSIEIEELFERPVDIEWTVKDGILYILQARPITTGPQGAHMTASDIDLNILDYELTFKVTGLSFLFTDVLNVGFKYLDPLFVCADDEFRQYFTNEKMAFAADYGYEWLSRPEGFQTYQSEFTQFKSDSDARLTEILSGNEIGVLELQEAIEIFGQLMLRYSKMDFQFTNLTFHRASESEALSQNLQALERFKDDAREWVNEFLLEETSFFQRLVEKISVQTKVPVNLLNSYRLSELTTLLSGREPEARLLSARDEAYVIYQLGDETRYASGEEARLFSRYIKSLEQSDDSSAVVGQIGSKTSCDLIHGIARVINVDYSAFEKMEKEMSEMEPGEILISEFTAPELLPACQKAKAVVTDLGGMLSHAAIVCREMGKPCIVGTKNASKLFKDGDKLALDMRSGNVTRID